MTETETETEQDQTALFSEYDCIKKVYAAKIKDVTLNERGGASFSFEDSNQTISHDSFSLKNKPIPETGMYYVIYENGYFSFSPDEVFNKGYKPVGWVAVGKGS